MGSGICIENESEGIFIDLHELLLDYNYTYLLFSDVYKALLHACIIILLGNSPHASNIFHVSQCNTDFIAFLRKHLPWVDEATMDATLYANSNPCWLVSDYYINLYSPNWRVPLFTAHRLTKEVRENAYLGSG